MDGFERRWTTLVESALEFFPNTEAGAMRRRTTAAFEELDRCYGAAGRHYHGWHHIGECLDRLAECRAPLNLTGKNNLTVEFALWYHDAIYDVTAHNNEEMSARLASQRLTDLGMPELASPASRLIRATDHSSRPATADLPVDLVRDIDLGILGADPERFDQYERQVRREYGHVPDPQFRSGRLVLLRKFLDRPYIYRLPWFRKKLEHRARRNLSRSIRMLGNDGERV